MNNNKLLDSILFVYLYAESFKVSDPERFAKLKFLDIIKSFDNTISEDRIAFAKRQLFGDKFLDFRNDFEAEPFHLTDLGIKAAQIGWYSKTASDRQIDENLKTNTLLSLKRSKYSLMVAILAFIIPTIISVYTLWTDKQQPTKEEFQALRQRIQKLELESEAKTTLNASATTPSDTLKMVRNKK